MNSEKRREKDKESERKCDCCLSSRDAVAWTCECMRNVCLARDILFARHRCRVRRRCHRHTHQDTDGDSEHGEKGWRTLWSAWLVTPLIPHPFAFPLRHFLSTNNAESSVDYRVDHHRRVHPQTNRTSAKRRTTHEQVTSVVRYKSRKQSSLFNSTFEWYLLPFFFLRATFLAQSTIVVELLKEWRHISFFASLRKGSTDIPLRSEGM